MPYVNATVANNAQGTLLAGISAVATTVVLNAGQGALFPSTFPFFAKIEQYDTAINNYRVLKREIVKVTGRATDTLTIVRSAGTCPSTYNSTTQTTTAFSFSANDTISHVLTAEQIKDIQDTLGTALQTSGGTMTGVLINAAGANIASATTTNLATATGNSLNITGAVTITGFGTVTAGAYFALTFTGAPLLTHNATSLILPGGANIQAAAGDCMELISLGGWNWKCIGYQKANGQAIIASVDVNGLTAAPFLKATTKYLVYDVAAGANRNITPNTIFVDYGSGSDGAATITGGTTTLTRDMQYTTLTITGTGILKTAGYRVFASTSISIQASGQLVTKETNGGNASGITAGTATALTTAGSTNTAKQGMAGVNGTTSGLSGGSSPTYTDTANFSSFISAVGTSGGNGGNSGSGVGGSATNPITNGKGPIAAFGYGKSNGFTALGLPWVTEYRYAAANGGGSGGNYCSGQPTGGGAAGGNNAGGIFLASPSITNAGTISANGGNGGVGGNASANANNNGTNGGGGGGGGGSGGTIFLLTESLTNTGGTIRANGGNGGNGGTGASAGNGGAVGGDGGQAGNGGAIILPTGYNGTVTANAGTVGSGWAVNGAAAAGAAGPAGTAGVISTY